MIANFRKGPGAVLARGAGTLFHLPSPAEINFRDAGGRLDPTADFRHGCPRWLSVTETRHTRRSAWYDRYGARF